MASKHSDTFVKITLREIYEVQQDMLIKLSELLTKIDYGNHEHRIGVLERDKWKITGLAGAVAAAVTVTISLLK